MLWTSDGYSASQLPYLNKWGEESKAQFKRCAIVEWNLIVFKLDCRTTVDSVEFNLVVPDSTGWNVSRTRIKFDKSTGGNGVKCTYLIMLHWVWHKFSAKFRRGDRACRMSNLIARGVWTWPYAVFTRETFTWGKLAFLLYCVIFFCEMHLPHVLSVSRVNKALDIVGFTWAQRYLSALSWQLNSRLGHHTVQANTANKLVVRETIRLIAKLIINT